MALTDKTVLITGATGMIGNHLVERLINTHACRKIIAVGRSEEKIKSVFAKYLTNDMFTYYVHDISVPLESIEDVDVIINAAGSIDKNQIFNHPTAVIKSNLAGTINVLEFAKKEKEKGRNIRIIEFSSATIYANNTDHDLCVDESDTHYTDGLEKLNAPYYESKRMIEVISSAYVKEFGIDVIVVRPSFIYGPTIIKQDSAFFEFISSVQMNRDITIINPNMARRDNIYIEDFISGLLTVISAGNSGEVYNISTNGYGDNYAAADEMAKAIVKMGNLELKTNICVEYYKKSEKRLPGMSLDNNKLRKLGWKPQFTLLEGISETFRKMNKLNF